MLLTLGTSSFITSLYLVPPAATRFEGYASAIKLTLAVLSADMRTRSGCRALGDFCIGAELAYSGAHCSELMLCANSLQQPPSLCLETGLEARDRLPCWLLNREIGS